MAKITGGRTKLGIEKQPTWGAAGVAVGAGDLAQVDSISITQDVTRLEGNLIGGGLGMRSDIDSGTKITNASIEMTVGYENKADVLLAQFFGDPQSPVEQNVGEGDYLHQILLDPSSNQNAYVTVAYQASTTETKELSSAAVTSITLSHEAPASELKLSAELVADQLELASATNTFAVVDAATLSAQRKVIVTTADSWRLNAEGGAALSGSDKVCPTTATLTLERPQSIVPTVCETTGNPAPIDDDFVAGTLELTFPSMADLTYFTAQEAGTTYKASFTVTSSAQIGSGDNYTFALFLPKLKIIELPDRTVDATGDIPITVVFEVLAATAAPTGMASVRPYIEITNTRTTSY